MRPRLERRWSVPLVACVALLASACQFVPNPGPGDTLPVDYVAPAGAAIVHGIAYGPDPAQLLDLYLPEPGPTPAPVLVWIHVGGWIAGSRATVPELVLRQQSRAGWAVVSMDHRLTRWQDGQLVNTHPAAVQDVDRVVRWIKAEGPALGLDGQRVVLIGGSSGAHLAALAASAPGEFVDPTLPPELASQSSDVAGAVPISAPLDLVTLVAQGDPAANAPRTMLGCPEPTPCDPAVVEDASPLHQVSAASSPAYIAGGSRDQWVPPSQHARPFHDELLAARALTDALAGERSVWLDVVETTGHNLDHTTLNVTYIERWLDLVGDGTWSGGGLRLPGGLSGSTGGDASG